MRENRSQLQHARYRELERVHHTADPAMLDYPLEGQGPKGMQGSAYLTGKSSESSGARKIVVDQSEVGRKIGHEFLQDRGKTLAWLCVALRCLSLSFDRPRLS